MRKGLRISVEAAWGVVVQSVNYRLQIDDSGFQAEDEP